MTIFHYLSVRHKLSSFLGTRGMFNIVQKFLDLSLINAVQKCFQYTLLSKFWLLWNIKPKGPFSYWQVLLPRLEQVNFPSLIYHHIITTFTLCFPVNYTFFLSEIKLIIHFFLIKVVYQFHFHCLYRTNFN